MAVPVPDQNRKPFHRASLRAKVLTPLLLTGILASIVSTWVTHEGIAAHLEDQAFRRAETLANSISHVTETVADPADLRRIVAAIGEEKDVEMIVIVSGNPQTVLASDRLQWLGKTLNELPKDGVAQDLSETLRSRKFQRYYHDDLRVYHVTIPLQKGSGATNGAVLVHLNAVPIQGQIWRATWRSNVWQLTLISGVTLLAYVLMSRFLLTPINAINATMARRTAGDRTTRAPELLNAELGGLAQNLNSMLDAFDQSQFQLKQSEQYLRAVMANVPTVLSGVDTKGVVTLSEGKGLQLLDLKAGESVGNSIFEIYRDFPELLDACRRCLAGEEATTTIRKGHLAFETRLSPLRDAEGKIIGAIGVSTDVSDRVRAEMTIQQAQHQLEIRVEERTAQLAAVNRDLQAEIAERQMVMGALREVVVALEEAKDDAERARLEAERANAAKSEFLSRMSHELRTPLNAILGFGQVLEMDDLNEEQRESVQFILKGGVHLLGLINEVLDISRVESGLVELSLEPVSVVDAVREAIDLARPLTGNENITLEWMLDGLEETYVLADQQRLKQVLLNLLSNGIKYNRPGGKVSVSAVSIGQSALRIEVRDTGFGISPQHLERLFVPFDRLDAEQSGIEGTGLGLMLSRRLAEAMNGTLEVESTQGVGSVFCLQLSLIASPLLQLDHIQTGSKTRANGWATSGHQKPTEDTAEPPIYRSTILCIEDNNANNRIMQAVLSTRPDIKLLCATEGRVGLELARTQHPDLIVLDQHLPDISGGEILRRLQADPETHNIAVVMLSADTTPRQMKRLLEEGASVYLTKPLNVQLFLRVVEENIKRSLAAHESGADLEPQTD